MAVDFGGGTFDVSMIELTPGGGDVRSMHGVPIGGELFDSLLFDLKVAPELQLDREYVVNGKQMPVPMLLRHMRTLHEIIAMVSDDRVRRALQYMHQADGDPLRMVDEIIYGGHAYNFFRAIENAKIALSFEHEATIAFRRPGIAIVDPGGPNRV